MKKILVTFMLITGVASIVYGCGMMLGFNGKPLDAAEISYIEKIGDKQSLTITRDFKDLQKTVWIIPVPGKSKDVYSDIYKGDKKFLKINALEPAYVAIEKSSLLFLDGVITFFKERNSFTNETFGFTFFIQQYFYTTNPFTTINIIYFLTAAAQDSSIGISDSKGVGQYLMPSHIRIGGVLVSDSIRKDGLFIENFDAENSGDIASHFKQKGLSIPEDNLKILDEYAKKDFSFVAVYLDDATKFSDKNAGVTVTFPIKDELFYYPLHAESLAGGDGYPETIIVSGEHIPRIYANIKKGTEYNFFIYKDKETQEIKRLTKIVIRANPIDLTEDLYIPTSTSGIAMFERLIYPARGIGDLFVFMLIFFTSCLATYIAGWVLRCKAQISPRIVRKIAFANMVISVLLTLTGFSVLYFPLWIIVAILLPIAYIFYYKTFKKSGIEKYNRFFFVHHIIMVMLNLAIVALLIYIELTFGVASLLDKAPFM